MQALRIVGFGLDCPDPSSPGLVTALSIILPLICSVGFSFVLIMAVRRVNPPPLRYLLFLLFIGAGILLYAVVYVAISLWLACGGLG